MELMDKTVVITGATGGIGNQIALAFGDGGARLALVGRNREKLLQIAGECREKGYKVIPVEADIRRDEDIKKIVEKTHAELGPIDILINNAGAMAFNPVGQYTGEEVEDLIMTNIYGPIRLTQAVLPGMLARRHGRIVNIGSIFGSLSFPYFSIYSASKYAIRGFSEALRRELEGTDVGVTYVAPRGTKTSQSEGFLEMAKKTGMNMDQPEKVARIILDAVVADAKEVYLGRPERFFIFLNKLFPSVIDKALRKNTAIMARYIT